jgi:hypothetical protein
VNLTFKAPNFLHTLLGGWATMLMGAFSYIADITTEKERTLRIGHILFDWTSSCDGNCWHFAEVEHKK